MLAISVVRREVRGSTGRARVSNLRNIIARRVEVKSFIMGSRL